MAEAETEQGFGPTIREIGTRFGIASTNGVNDHLMALQNKGLIMPSHQKARAKVLTKKARTLLGLVVPMRTTRAREMLLEAAAAVAAKTYQADSVGAELREALDYLWQANELWQGSQIRTAPPLGRFSPTPPSLAGGAV